MTVTSLLLLLLLLLPCSVHARAGSRVILTRRQLAVRVPADPEGTCYDERLRREVPFGHEEMWKCAIAVADVNPKDGHISGAEIDAVEKAHMSMAERWAVSAASGDTRHHLRDCCGSFFGSITKESMLRYKDTCVPRQADRCMLKTLCDRAAAALGKTGQIY